MRPYAVVILLLVAVGAAGLNVQKMRTAAAIVRDNGAVLRIAATSMEVTRGQGTPELLAVTFDQFLAQAAVLVGGGTAAYLEAADRNGPLGLPLSELRVQDERLREQADQTIAAQLLRKPGLVAAPGSTTGGPGCRATLATPAAPVSVAVPAGGVTLRSSIAQPVRLRRFADVPTVGAGTLAAGRPARLSAPVDRAADAWVAVFTAGRIARCPPG